MMEWISTQSLAHERTADSPVEVKVKDYTVETNLNRQPQAHGGSWSLRCAVRREDGDKRPHNCRQRQGVEHFTNADIGNLVSFMLVAIQVAPSMSQLAKNVEFPDGIEVEGDGVVWKR